MAESEAVRSIGGEVQNKISFAMCHGLCDRLGFNRLIKSTRYHFFCLKGGKAYSDEGIYTQRMHFEGDP